jgi:predicted Zn-dependent protease
MKKYCIVLAWLIFGIFSQSKAQTKDFELAEEYFAQSEFEKAREMYEKLARSPRNLPLIYPNYLKTLVQLKDFKEAERLAKRMSKDNPQSPNFRVDYGSLLEMQGNIPQADKEFNEIVEDFKKQPEPALAVVENFLRLDKADWGEKMILATRKQLKDKGLFAIELAEVYRFQGKQPEMIQEYLNYGVNSRENLDLVKNLLQDRLQKSEDFDKLEQTLLSNLQKTPDEITYNELLLWIYLQQKRFARAFIQAKALDKRYQLEGNELLNIGQIATKNGDYKSAAQMFEYIIKTYPTGANYPFARNLYLKAKEEAIKSTFPINKAEIAGLLQEYKVLIIELGKNHRTLEALRNMALLNAFYLDRKDTAIVMLNEAIQVAQGRVDFMAQCKTDLGDIYLLKNEAWESTLLYSQVEMLKKEHPIGHEAKLKNAKLSYYKGEFDLAVEHLNILKEATSREIANDAMDLSLLIQDNLAFDTLGTALRDYSKIDLMIFQHQEAQALQALDTMLTKYANNTILSHVIFTKAQLLVKTGKPADAVPLLKRISEEFAQDIRADDAYFLLGKIYEENLGEKDKAKEVYENFLTKFPASVFTAEARKRFRILRGDFVN